MGFEYWDFPAEAAVREPPPASIADNDRLRLEKMLHEGEGPPTGSDDLFLWLGLDFGTSSTKMIVRLPFEAGEPTIAIPAPSFCRGEGNPYLWKTVLWLRNDGGFRPYPEAGTKVLNTLKQGIIRRPGDTTLAETIVASSRAQAVVAYLALAIRYARGWLLLNRKSLFRRGLFRRRKPVWFVNIGMPAASYNEPDLAVRYRHIGAAALQLANSRQAITTDTTQSFLGDHKVAEAGESEQVAADLGVAVVPETAAEMMGFTKSTRSAPGLYLTLDVGAMTLDACMFRLTHRLDQEGVGMDHYLFMATQVRPLGVESFHWFLSEGKTEPDFIHQCERMLWYVVWHTKQDRDPHADEWKPGNSLPVFLTGGGAENRLHLDIVKSLDPWLRQFLPESGVRLIDPPVPMPQTLDLPEPIQHPRRINTAWGLSYPEIGRIHPTHSITDIKPPTRRDYGDAFVSKDQI